MDVFMGLVYVIWTNFLLALKLLSAPLTQWIQAVKGPQLECSLIEYIIFIIYGNMLFLFYIEANIFRALINLERLYLQDNRLIFIHNTALPPVKVLYLQFNNLTHIPNYLSDVDQKEYSCEKIIDCRKYAYWTDKQMSLPNVIRLHFIFFDFFRCFQYDFKWQQEISNKLIHELDWSSYGICLHMRLSIKYKFICY